MWGRGRGAVVSEVEAACRWPKQEVVWSLVTWVVVVRNVTA